MKRMILIGASGTIGRKIQEAFKNEEYEILRVGRKDCDYCANMEDEGSLQSLFGKIGKVDAVVCAAGDVALAPLETLERKHWQRSLQSKLMGQINAVIQGLPHLKDNGSFTLVSGIVSEYPIKGGIPATTANRAVEAFVMAAACEMPRGIRINVVSPNMLTESEAIFRPYFPGMKSVTGEDVANAFKKSVMGIQTGRIFRVF